MSHLLTDLLYLLALASALAAQVMIIRSIAATPAEVVGPGATVVRRSREMMWTVLTAAALAITFAFVWKARHDDTGRHHVTGTTVVRTASDGRLP